MTPRAAEAGSGPWRSAHGPVRAWIVRTGVRVWLCLAALGAVGGGCTLVRIEQGAPVSVALARALQPGDTKAHVLATLGAPQAMFPIPGGSFFEYRFSVTDADALELSAVQASLSIASTDRRTDRLVVRFDRDGRVREVGYPVGLVSAMR